MRLSNYQQVYVGLANSPNTLSVQLNLNNKMDYWSLRLALCKRLHYSKT